MSPSFDAMVYVVERYLPGLSRSDFLRRLAELERTTQEGNEGSVVRYLGSTIVIGDEACFCEFEASSETAVAEANRRAGLSFDRIVPAVSVTPTNSEPRRVQMSTPTTVSVPMRLRHRWPYAAVAALLAAASTAAVLVISTGTDTSTSRVENTTAPSIKAPSVNPRVQALSEMSPKQIAAAFGTSGISPRVSPYAQALSAMSPAQIAAGFGTDEQSPYVRALSSLTPAQIAAGFGTGDVTSGLTPKERRYVEAISSMSPAQIAAAFGNQR
jgi:hypothetical protein